MHHQVVHRDDRNPRREDVPVRAAIERHVAAAIGADIEDIVVHRVLANHVHRRGGESLGDRAPRLPEVLGDVDVRGHVVVAIAVKGDVRALPLHPRRDHPRHPAVARERLARVPPALPVRLGDVHVPVVRAHPDQAEVLRRLVDGGHARERHVASLLGSGEVAAQRLPRLPLVHGAEELVGPEVEDPRVVLRELDRRRPVVAVRGLSERIARPHGVRRTIRIAPRVEAELIAVVGGAVARVDLDVHAVPPTDEAPLVDRRAAAARALEGAVVLRAAVDVVRRRHVDLDGVELPHRLRVDTPPRLAVVVARIESAVVSDHDPPRHLRIDPHRVVIDVHVARHDVLPRLAAVFGAHQRDPRDVDPVGVQGVDLHQPEVVPVGVDDLVQRLVVRASPRRPAVVGAVHLESADVGLEEVGVGVVELGEDVGDGELVVLDLLDQRLRVERRLEIVAADERLDRLWILRQELFLRHPPETLGVHSGAAEIPLRLRKDLLIVDADVEGLRLRRTESEFDPADIFAARKPAGQTRPALAAIGALPDATSRPRLDEVPRATRPLPQGGVDHVGVRRIDLDVDRARVATAVDRIPTEHAGPALPAILGAEEPALSALGVELPERGDVHAIAIARIDGDAPDPIGLTEPHRLPRRSRVGGEEDAVPPVGGARRVVLPGANPYARRVRGIHFDVPHDQRRLLIEERREGVSVVVGSPEAARSVRDVVGERRAGDRLDVDDPPPLDHGPHRPPLEPGEEGVLRQTLVRLPARDLVGERGRRCGLRSLREQGKRRRHHGEDEESARHRMPLLDSVALGSRVSTPESRF